MKWFDYVVPQSLDEAVALMTAHPAARPLAGGTDLLVQMRSGRKETDFVVDVKRVPELNEIAYDPVRGLTLGAAVPCYRICRSAPVSMFSAAACWAGPCAVIAALRAFTTSSSVPRSCAA